MNNANDNPQNARRDTPGADSLAQLVETPAVRAVHIFSQVGTLAETSRQTGISLLELSRMSREPWWQRELQGIQREQTAMENLRLSRIYGKTIDQLEAAVLASEEIVQYERNRCKEALQRAVRDIGNTKYSEIPILTVSLLLFLWLCYVRVTQRGPWQRRISWWRRTDSSRPKSAAS